MKSFFNNLLTYVKKHRVGVALCLIILLALFFRFWQLASLPPGLHPDEAANGLDIFRIQDGDWRALYNTNGPREALFFYIQAIFVTLFGNTIFALRVAPAFIGVATVLATYTWLNEWFSKRTALVAALFTATGSYAVLMSRNGYRASMVPLMVALSAWLLTKSFKLRKWYWYVLSGLSLGAGLYTYISFRMLPLIMLAIFIYGLIFFRRKTVNFILPLIVISIVTIITLIPLGLYALKNPADVLGGRSSVGITNSELNDGSVVKTFGENIVKTALMFNFKGDNNYRHNLGGAPMLNAFVGIMFILGLLLSLRRIRDIRYFSLLAIFAAMLVPMVLTAEGIPHALRAIGVVPVIYAFAAIGLIELVSRWKGVFPRNPAAYTPLLALIAIVLLLAINYDYRRYFVAWANDPNTYEAYSEDMVATAEYLNANSSEVTRYVVVGEYPDKTIEYLTKHKSDYTQLEYNELSQLPANQSYQLVVLNYEQSQTEPQIDLSTTKLIYTGISAARPGAVLFRVYERNIATP